MGAGGMPAESVWVSPCRRCGRGGAAGRERMLNRQEGAGKGCQREVRWLECGRQGRGNEFPLPVSPSPRGDIPTVQHMGRSRRKTGHGCPSAPPQIRFPAGSTPDTAAHLISPRTAHAPREGAGEERRRCGRGGGRRQKRMGIFLQRRDRGGGGRQKCMGIFLQRRGRGGGAGEVHRYPCEGAGGVGVPGKCLGIPTKARAGWGMPAEVHGYPCRRRGRGGGAGEVHRYPLPQARAGRGYRQKRMLNRQEGAGKGCQREVRWLECGRQGRGNKFPLPVGPSPRGDIPTVQHMGRSRRRPGHGFPSAPPRIRFPTSSTPGTAAHLISPRTDPAPGVRQEAETWIASCYSLRSGYPYRSMHSW